MIKGIRFAFVEICRCFCRLLMEGFGNARFYTRKTRQINNRNSNKIQKLQNKYWKEDIEFRRKKRWIWSSYERERVFGSLIYHEVMKNKKSHCSWNTVHAEQRSSVHGNGSGEASDGVASEWAKWNPGEVLFPKVAAAASETERGDSSSVRSARSLAARGAETF